MRVFGCLAYPMTIDPKYKFGEKATRGIYIGRSTTQPAYMVYIPGPNRIVVTPNVTFVETIFPGVGRGVTENPVAGRPGGADALTEPDNGWAESRAVAAGPTQHATPPPAPIPQAPPRYRPRLHLHRRPRMGLPI